MKFPLRKKAKFKQKTKLKKIPTLKKTKFKQKDQILENTKF